MTNVVSLKTKPEQLTTQAESPRLQRDTTKFSLLEKTAAQLYREGNYTQIVQGPALPLPDRLGGKTIVENKPFGSITVSSMFTEDGFPVLTPEIANTSAKLGAATHGFFYHDTDFLLSAAKEYATLEENEMFRHRNIADVNFVRDTLDFLTNGNFTESDVADVQAQMESVVYELSRQIKNGESPDLTKLQSKLTIGGADVSMAQLLDVQKVGTELKNAFDNVTVGQLDIRKYGQMGIAKAMGDLYGSDKGEIGEMFSSAITRLYDKGLAKIKRTYNEAEYIFQPWKEFEKDAVNTALNIANTLSKLDTSDRENLNNDFANKLATIQHVVENYCNRYNISTSYVGLAGDMADLTKYFSQWMNQM